ncbi:hypothetical protein HDU76_007470 [Blyttiomyces sp. JEL0837]|nr:hypothetical protein HDU76_007470 [Blyttiomyces sp. JEL0837]
MKTLALWKRNVLIGIFVIAALIASVTVIVKVTEKAKENVAPAPGRLSDKIKKKTEGTQKPEHFLSFRGLHVSFGFTIAYLCRVPQLLVLTLSSPQTPSFKQNPECCKVQSYHPPSPITSGEEFVKLIYETLRSSPDWEHTAFIIAFDEHGGFADHVPSPPAPMPGDGKYQMVGDNVMFKFDRYGVRVPALLISPYVRPGIVQHGLDYPDPQYDHTSILKFVETLWDLPPLTERDKNARGFEHLFDLDSPRQDCPETL